MLTELQMGSGAAGLFRSQFKRFTLSRIAADRPMGNIQELSPGNWRL